MNNSLLHTFDLTWRPDRKRLTRPYYLSLATALKEDIYRGILPAYTKLPPQRELACFLGFNVSTITKAYRLCQMNGLVTAVVGRGTFVVPLTIMDMPFDRETIANPEDIGATASESALPLTTDFKNPDEEVQTKEKKDEQRFIPDGVINMAYQEQKISSMHSDFVRKIGIELLEDPRSSKLFSEPAYLGSPFQVDAGRIWLTDQGVDLTSRSSIYLTMGIGHALGVVLSSLFQPGFSIAIDTYTDPYTAAVLPRLLHAKMVPIESDEEGMSTIALEKACRTGDIRALYVLPMGNPTNTILEERRRVELSTIAQKHDLLIIEDDRMAPLRKRKLTPLYNLVPDQTVYLSSISQAINFGLRITYMVAPNRYKKAIAETLFMSMHKISPFDAQIAGEIISRGFHHDLIAEKQELIRFRNWCFKLFFPDFKISPDATGQWLTLPKGLSGEQTEMALRKMGVQVLCARHFALGEQAHDNALHIATCGPETTEQTHAGLQIIKRYLEALDLDKESRSQR